jgi:hypothetical protein
MNSASYRVSASVQQINLLPNLSGPSVARRQHMLLVTRIIIVPFRVKLYMLSYVKRLF